MSSLIEQRTCIIFCFCNEDIAIKPLEMLQIGFDEENMLITIVFEWYNMFQEGRVRVEGEPCFCRSFTSTYDEYFRDLGLNGRLLTIRDIINPVSELYGSCYQF